jgi:hypothetical protein
MNSTTTQEDIKLSVENRTYHQNKQRKTNQYLKFLIIITFS